MGTPADGRACQCRGKLGYFRASCFDSAGAEHHNRHDRICLHFWSRLAHVVVYTLGIPVLRTLSFAAGFVAQALLVLAIFKLT